MIPTYCLICAKQIVCNMAKMKFNPVQLHSLYFLLFVANKYIFLVFPNLEPYGKT